MSNHTRGGWHRNVAPASHYPVIFAGRNTHVAQVITKGLPVEEQEENADLIAAAPDLLAALEELLPWCLGLYDTTDAKAAVAKAYGRYGAKAA